MKVLVLGAGVIGVTTAYYLAKGGCEVTVLDRQPGPGLETSFANAGEISPGYASPWAGPGVPTKAVRWMFERYGPLVFRPNRNPEMWSWIVQMIGNCTAKRYALNKSRMVPIAEYSRDCLRSLREDIGISYDHQTQGTLQLFRKRSQLDAAVRDIEVLKKFDVAFELLDVGGCVQAEPALARVQESFLGGLRLLNDETGDCHVFTQKLAEVAAGMGVKFEYGVKIDRIAASASIIDHVLTDDGTFKADAYVVALGSFSPILLKSLGVKIPVYPVKGYSITLPIIQSDAAPRSTVMDETYKVAITRLGDRIRVGGTAEIGDYKIRLNEKRREVLDRSLKELFPNCGDFSKATFWSGLRPMTPDGPPIIGPTPFNNLFLNTGHGTLGWTMACGSARVIADQVTGHRPEIPDQELGMSRYQ
jgi:D-amino-acid dehydrogenase